jgi:hypothetical protein
MGVRAEAPFPLDSGSDLDIAAYTVGRQAPDALCSEKEAN